MIGDTKDPSFVILSVVTALIVVASCIVLLEFVCNSLSVILRNFATERLP